MTKFIIQSSIPHIRMFLMDCFQLAGNLFVQPVICCFYTIQPFVISRSCNIAKLTQGSDRVMVFFMFRFDCLINVFLSFLAQPRLLSISASFFKKSASICACSFSARKIRFSARSFSSSDISASGFRFPRLSRRASTPCFSYFIV